MEENQPVNVPFHFYMITVETNKHLFHLRADMNNNSPGRSFFFNIPLAGCPQRANDESEGEKKPKGNLLGLQTWRLYDRMCSASFSLSAVV